MDDILLFFLGVKSDSVIHAEVEIETGGYARTVTVDCTVAAVVTPTVDAEEEVEVEVDVGAAATF